MPVNVTLTATLVSADLEAEFYSWAVNGQGIPTALRGGGPASTGGMKANLTGPILVRLFAYPSLKSPMTLATLSHIAGQPGEMLGV